MDGGSQHPGSGRIWRFHRDGRLGEFLIEARTTDKHTYSIDKREFLDIRKEALKTPPGLLPAMQVTIQDLDLVVMSLIDFQEREVRLITLEARLEADEQAN